MTVRNIQCQSTIAALLSCKPEDSIIQMKEKTGREPETSVSFHLRVSMLDGGVTTGETLKGNEQWLLYDKVHIEELILPLPNRHCVSAQDAQYQLIDAYSELLSRMFFIQVCGYTADSINSGKQNLTLQPIDYGFNKPTAPSSKRIIRPQGVMKDEDLTDPQHHSFSLDLIDKAVIHAKCAYHKIRPTYINNRKFYVLYLHPTQVTQLRDNTDPDMWKHIQNANEWMCLDENHPLLEESLGIYNDVVLRQSVDVTNGVHSINNTAVNDVRRAVLLGSQSVIMAFGRDYSFENFSIKNYENPSTVALETIIGMKKARFPIPYDPQDPPKDSQDLATVVIPTYTPC
ncbi:DUF4043 family protein [Bartonella senegalensis]|uniref:phage capsid family protein n=1 Tax=Bartonella senegalensis TaxID=1468418 RepID=UPI000316412B|nr:DUF4043 family protein [Bartonella senegalensis]